MASSTRSKRGEVAVSSPSQQSDVEDPGSDSDYSPGSLIIDIGTEGIGIASIIRLGKITNCILSPLTFVLYIV